MQNLWHHTMRLNDTKWLSLAPLKHKLQQNNYESNLSMQNSEEQTRKIIIIMSNLRWWIRLWCSCRSATGWAEKQQNMLNSSKNSFRFMSFTAWLMNYDWHLKLLDTKARKSFPIHKLIILCSLVQLICFFLSLQQEETHTATESSVIRPTFYAQHLDDAQPESRREEWPVRSWVSITEWFSGFVSWLFTTEMNENLTTMVMSKRTAYYHY